MHTRESICEMSIYSDFVLRIPWALPLLYVFLAGGRRVRNTEIQLASTLLCSW